MATEMIEEEDDSQNLLTWIILIMNQNIGHNNNWKRRPYPKRDYGHRNDRGGRRFTKFVDMDYSNNESKYWTQNDRNYDNNNRNNSCQGGENVTGAGIYPWIRRNKVKPLIIPPQEQVPSETFSNDKVDEQNFPEPAENSYLSVRNIRENLDRQKAGENSVLSEKPTKESSISSSINNSVSTNTSTSNATIDTTKIKQEKGLDIKSKHEKKSSSSSSSSSSSESSSSEEENEPAKKTPAPAVVKPEPIASNAKRASSPLNIKLKPKENQKSKSLPASSSSSSSSSSAEDEPVAPTPPPPKPVPVQKEKKTKLPEAAKHNTTKSSKKKNSSEDDVVCMGKWENKIVLEDDSDSEESAEEDDAKSTISNKESKKSNKKSAEKCMLCSKKGHTSFQCQMICKNCSAPYHGYRTCPKPANLNTMLQLFMEFCMQQLHTFSVEKQLPSNGSQSFPTPQIDTAQPSSSVAANKSHKLKRKQAKANDNNDKTKMTKKRKISKKKSTKKGSNDSSDDTNDDDTDSETSSSESEEESSDSPAESLVSSKKKLKTKNKNALKTPFNINNFTPSPVNLPLVLNGLPNLNVGTPSVQNPNSALNTLLLTQMFQNAIGSLKQ